MRRLVLAPIVAYQRVVSPALPRRCKYEPTCSAYAVQAIRDYGILRGLVLAAWRVLRCNPFSHGGLDPVDGPAPVPPPRPEPMNILPIANTRPAADRRVRRVLVFFHDSVGFSWGFSIIALTVVVRAALIPLTLKQFKSMQALQRLSPEIKALQAKYKDDRQRLNQEMMKFYQENKVNPFGSCLPLVLQLPVFFSLFYMLRKDLKLDICAADRPVRGRALATIGHERQLQPGRSRERAVPLHPGPDAQGDRRRAGRPARPLRGLAAALERADVGHGGPQPALHHDRAAVRVRAVHPGLPGRPARLLDHDELLDRRPAVRHPARGRVARARGAGQRTGRQAGRRGGRGR